MKNKHQKSIRKVKHFLLGAGLALIITFTSSSVFAAFTSSDKIIPCEILGGKMVLGSVCSAADSSATSPASPAGVAATEKFNLEQDLKSGALKPGQPIGCRSAGMKQLTVENCIKIATEIASGSSSSSQQQQPEKQQTSQPSLQQTTVPTQSDSGISDLKKMIEEMKFEKQKEQEQEQKEMLEIFQKMTEQMKQQNQQQLFGQQQFEQQSEEEKPAIDKSKLTSVKNPGATLAKKGLKNVDKLLNTLSKKFNKQKTKTKKIAVVRSVAKGFMKLCIKYAPDADDEEFDDEESFTCDEFVAELSEPIAAALKSKDADLAFELTFDALNVNFKELFNSLIQR